MEICELFDLSHTLAAEYLIGFRYPWEALAGLKEWLFSLQRTLGRDFYALSEGVFVHETAKLDPSARLLPPAVVCAGAELRAGAFLRGGTLVGENCVVGNSTELKNCILFDEAKVPHFNYVGDAILGYRAHMGAGAIVSNVKADKGVVFIRCGSHRVSSNLRKCGAFVGDNAEIGCNCVLCPGVVVGRNTSVYPLSLLRGSYPGDSVVKQGEVFPKRSGRM